MIAFRPRTLLWKTGFALLGLEAIVIVALAWYAASASTSLAQATLIGGAALLVLTWLTLLITSRKLAQSVSQLIQSVDGFTSGQLSDRVERPDADELASLAESLNRMAEQLRLQIDLLRDQRSEQQAIYQSMSNGLIALDLDQRIISMNQAAERLLHLSGEAARGRLMQEVAREPELNRLLEDALESREPLRRELRLSAGRGLTIEAACEPLRNAKNQIVGVLLFVNDLTQLRRLEAIRSDFAANVSHELRTPITNIKGYVETMLEIGVQDESQTRKFLEIISRNTARLSSIVEDLLVLARLEQPSAKARLERSRHSIKRIVESAVAQFESDLNAKGMQLRLHIQGELIAMVNPQLIEQALCNLLSNAIKYSSPGTAVTIKAAAENGNIQLAVSDEGPGIPAEHLPRLFERFYRVDRARSREMGGTGLGLAIVKHIAQVHGGKVDVRSQVGRGSEFRLTLPLPLANM